MAQLLGQADQIDSLRQDLSDLQSVVSDAISHVGRIRCTSWRSPDKLACDLDVAKLLESYRYSVGCDQSNQLSHLVLIETIIDRLVLMIQLMNKFLDRIKMDEASSSACQGRSVGIVAKRYWLRLVRLVSHFQQQNNNSLQTNRSKNSILEEPLTKNNISQIIKNKFGTHNLSNNSLTDISKEDSNKATQTADTSFVPCDSCHQNQRGLKSIADLIVETFTVLKYNKTGLKSIKIKDAWMTASEINTVIQMVTSNLMQIQEEALKVASTLEPLKDQLRQYEEKFEELEGMGERLVGEHMNKECEWKREKEKIEKDFEVYKKSFKLVEERAKKSENEFKLKLESSEAEVKKLKSELETMTEKYNNLAKILPEKEKLLEYIKSENEKYREIEVERDQLLETVKELELNKEEALSNLAKFMGLLKLEQDRVKRDEEYNQEMMEKHNQLVEDLEKLDNENDSLQSTIAKMTAAKIELEAENTKYKHVIDELGLAVEQYMHKINELERTTSQMKERSTSPNLVNINPEEFSYLHSLPKKFNLYTNLIQNKLQELAAEGAGSLASDFLNSQVAALQSEIKELKKQQSLLVNYPDLNPKPTLAITDCEDIATDMSNQIEANKVRINVLQNENLKLGKSVQRIQSGTKLNENVVKQVIPKKSDHSANEHLPSSNNLHLPSNNIHLPPTNVHPSPVDLSDPSIFNKNSDSKMNSKQSPIKSILKNSVDHFGSNSSLNQHDPARQMNRHNNSSSKHLEHSNDEKDLFVYLNRTDESRYANSRYPPIRKQNYSGGAQAAGGAKTHQSPRRNSINTPTPYLTPHPPGRIRPNLDQAFNPVELSFVVGRRPVSSGSDRSRRETRKIASAKK